MCVRVRTGVRTYICVYVLLYTRTYRAHLLATPPRRAHTDVPPTFAVQPCRIPRFRDSSRTFSARGYETDIISKQVSVR